MAAPQPAETNSAQPLPAPENAHSYFHRSVGGLSAVAINMTQMCGIGPFITIPAMIAAMNGPQAIFGWVVGAILAIADGLIWAELGASLPGEGGSYVYLRQAFQYRTGKLMPFLFVWTAVLAIPLIMSTGLIGFTQYLGYFFPHLSWGQQHVIAVGLGLAVIVVLYRRIESVKLVTTALWIIMLLAVTLTIAAAFTHFDAHLAFDFPISAFEPSKFFSGLGAGLIIAIYDYLGYNTTAYMAEELKNPGRDLPRSIVISILGIMAIYLPLNIGVLGVVPWQQAEKSTSVATIVLTQNWGHTAAGIVTVLILVAAFASICVGLLGGSRVPFHAAREGLFIQGFSRLHRRHGFPHVGLLAMGTIMIAGSFFNFVTVINMLVAVTVLVQSLAQVVAVTVLRHRQPHRPRPYRQLLYPLPSIIAAVGWVYVYFSADRMSILLSIAWVVLGLVAFLIWARAVRTWPFGSKEISENFDPQHVALGSR